MGHQVWDYPNWQNWPRKINQLPIQEDSGEDEESPKEDNPVKLAHICQLIGQLSVDEASKLYEADDEQDFWKGGPNRCMDLPLLSISNVYVYNQTVSNQCISPLF